MGRGRGRGGVAGPLTLQPFDVVVVPFPYGDAVGVKRRPAVVVSHPALATEQARVWVAMVTSAPGPWLRGDALVTDLEAAGLARTCRVRAAKLTTLDLAEVVRTTGALGDADRASLRSALGLCVGW